MPERSTMIYPPIEDLLDKVDSKFSLVSLAARRGRQINSYFSQLGEGLGAIGLILPAVLDIATVFVPLAATGLAATMLGAVVFHLRRGETKETAPSLVLLILAAVVAWGRFGPYAF